MNAKFDRTKSSVAAVVVGSAMATAADHALTRPRSPVSRTATTAIGLIAAAAIYPLAARPMVLHREESVALTAATAIAAASIVLPQVIAQRLLGIGWIAHAVYDAAFDHDTHPTRLPRWYAPWCAGIDVAIGLSLIIRPSR